MTGRLVLALLFTGPLLAPAALRAVEYEPGRPSLIQNLLDEEKWRFHPKAGRPDIFVDALIDLQLERQLKQAIALDSKSGTEPGSGAPIEPKPGEEGFQQALDALLALAQAEERKVQALVAAHKWDDAIRTADAAIRLIEPKATKPEVRTLVSSIRSFRDQAEDAKIRDEAQVAFDALGLKIQGILWSESNAKSRLAIIAGEPRALAVNDRIKDCVVINIDSDRVDFRFHFKRKRFEFPRYVGEHASK